MGMHPMISFDQMQLVFESYNFLISQICGWQRENHQCIWQITISHEAILATTNVVPSTLIAKEGDNLWHHPLTHGVSEFEQTEMGMRNMHFFQSERKKIWKKYEVNKTLSTPNQSFICWITFPKISCKHRLISWNFILDLCLVLRGLSWDLRS